MGRVTQTDTGSRPATRVLENGDRLTRVEFERCYEAMPWVKKAELIEGVVYMPSPARLKKHAAPHGILVTWLGNYAASTPGVESADNASVRLDLDNEPQPDAMLRLLPEAGGQTRDSDDDFVEGPPELAAEVAGSSASYDLHSKKEAYRRNGLREYIVWVTEDPPRLYWWELRDGRYDPIEKDSGGLLKSRVFPGLWLDADALLTNDFARVLKGVADGLASTEHGEFVARLKAALERSRGPARTD